jgi:hypothetical protein
MTVPTNKCPICDKPTWQDGECLQCQVAELRKRVDILLKAVPIENCPKCKKELVHHCRTRDDSGDYWDWYTCIHCGYKLGKNRGPDPRTMGISQKEDDSEHAGEQ